MKGYYIPRTSGFVHMGRHIPLCVGMYMILFLGVDTFVQEYIFSIGVYIFYRILYFWIEKESV